MGTDAATRMSDFALADRYLAEDGTIYLSGLQALVRMLLTRSRLDRRNGLNTSTYVSGYEGSPLAGYDLELERQSALLRAHAVVHQPGLNEELAATAVSGTQLARVVADLQSSGVIGVWYGKAPGLDRATDALRHANLIGVDGKGGAVALVGDDPAAKSSSVPCASEFALADLAMPTFYPSDPGEVLVHALHAVELSRASGLWSAIKITTAVADGATTTAVEDGWKAPDLSGLPDGLVPYAHEPSAHLLGASLAKLEQSMHLERLPIAMHYIQRSKVNCVIGGVGARIGLVAAGTTYLALRQALSILGIDDDGLCVAGLRVLKLGVVYPLEPSAVRDFAQGLQQILVIEDKRAFIEDAIKTVLYGRTDAPAVYGKRFLDGSPLFSPLGELDADAILAGLIRYLPTAGIKISTPADTKPRARISLQLAQRMPFFCSGCPHNSSTKVAPGTLVGAGIGCHAMLLLMPGEHAGKVSGLSQMGGEGAQWIGIAPFVSEGHYVQNIGDGTFAHSGSLAIRAAVAAGVNVTFKLLRNSTVAMTGGQDPVGQLGLNQLTALLYAEGVKRIVVTTDDPRALRRQVRRGTTVRHRGDLLEIQEELAAIDGVTVLIHDQECAAEKRRKRRRGKGVTPKERVFINQRVCEGCGDCGTKSNCLSVQPVETEFGRKTQINQSSCNFDFSCLSGDCPSFLTVIPGRANAKTAVDAVKVAPEPSLRFSGDSFSMRITGVGGTGVVTIAQILATAAAIEGRHVRSLDQTGLAQKGGAVVSDLKITSSAVERASKVGRGQCDLYLGCDMLVATDPVNLAVLDASRSVSVVSSTQVPTGAMVIDTATIFPAIERVTDAIADASHDAHFVDAGALAERLLGDELYTNMILVGAAYQIGAIPLGADTIERAITLNGTAVSANIAAFRHGRNAMLSDAAHVEDERDDLDRLVANRIDELTAYQNAAYAKRYARFVEYTEHLTANVPDGAELTRAVAVNLHKLMAYKDEYEVARLSVDPQLIAEIEKEFGAGARYAYRLHPPILRALGLSKKITLGRWFRLPFRVLYAARRVRGTHLDIFGYTRVRKLERALIDEYRATVRELLDGVTESNVELAVRIASLPDMVRGYEHIKLRTVESYRRDLAELMREYRLSASDLVTAPKS